MVQLPRVCVEELRCIPPFLDNTEGGAQREEYNPENPMPYSIFLYLLTQQLEVWL